MTRAAAIAASRCAAHPSIDSVRQGRGAQIDPAHRMDQMAFQIGAIGDDEICRIGHKAGLLLIDLALEGHIKRLLLLWVRGYAGFIENLVDLRVLEVPQ